MDPDDPIPLLLLLLALLLASGFLVAVEFAALTLRRRRVEQIVRDDPSRAAAVGSATEKAEQISLAAQLGAAFLTLLLGVLTAELAVVTFTRLSYGAAVALGLTIVAIVYLLLSQQLPRLVGAQRPLWITSRPILLLLRAFTIVLRPLLVPLAWLLEGLARAVGLSRSALFAPIYTIEDLRELLVQGHEQGVVEKEEREMIRGVFDFSGTVAREVMTPRIDIVAVPTDIELEQLITMVVSEGHSRLPVYDSSIDNVVGVLLAKDLLPLLVESGGPRAERFDVTALMREAYFVPDSKPIDDILQEFRQTSVHLAIVIDEFGGTYGLVTLEDLLEEIVGEIHDEYDIEGPEFADTPEGDILIDGGVAISEVNERYDLDIPDEDFDTIGGFIFGTLGRVPVTGDRVELEAEAGHLEVEEAEERRVVRVRLHRPGNPLTADLT